MLSQQSVLNMIAPVGVGPYAVGLAIDKRGEGWYFSHSGGNWGFICDMYGHVRKGYGLAIMTNSDSGGALIRELESRIAAASTGILWTNPSSADPLVRVKKCSAKRGLTTLSPSHMPSIVEIHPSVDRAGCPLFAPPGAYRPYGDVLAGATM